MKSLTSFIRVTHTDTVLTSNISLINCCPNGKSIVKLRMLTQLMLLGSGLIAGDLSCSTDI